MQADADKTIAKLLAEATISADQRLTAIRGKTGIGATVERLQIIEAKKAMRELLGELWGELNSTIKSSSKDSAVASADMGADWDEKFLKIAFPNAYDREAVRRYLAAAAERNVQAALARVTATKLPLSRRVYNSRSYTSGLVDRRINSLLARGASWSVFAAEVRDLISPRTPGGVSYAARRLARTEINNAYHALTIESNKDKPWNTGMVWALSKSHPMPDICNAYASESPYPKDEVPAKPHPHCFCYTYPEVVTEAVFFRHLRAGDYNAWMAKNYGQQYGGAARAV